MKELNSKKVIVFDFDGTLVDSMAGFGEIAARVMERYYGCDFEWARQRYRQTAGLPFSLQLERIFPKHKNNQQATLEYESEKSFSYKERPFYPDVEASLLWLKERGMKLAVSSNNYHSLLVEKLRGLNSFFDIVLGYQPGFLKGRGHFTWIQQKLNVGPSQMIFVGDSLHDAKMAKECDVCFIAKSGLFSEREFKEQRIALCVIPDLISLKRILFDSSLHGSTSNADWPHANAHSRSGARYEVRK